MFVYVFLFLADIPNVPLKPQVLVYGNDSLFVSWEAPEANGMPITHYSFFLIPTPNGGQPPDAAANQSYAIITGLNTGIGYTVSIRAWNGVGSSNLSLPSEYATPGNFIILHLFLV